MWASGRLLIILCSLPPLLSLVCSLDYDWPTKQQFGTSVGSKALSLRQALVVAAVVEFSGAVLMGSHVVGASLGVERCGKALIPLPLPHGRTSQTR